MRDTGVLTGVETRLKINGRCSILNVYLTCSFCYDYDFDLLFSFVLLYFFIDAYRKFGSVENETLSFFSIYSTKLLYH